ncbi:MAG: mannose-1-phosphate guanylyltransferase, partial [Candidatus Dormibacteraceae bacterium]
DREAVFITAAADQIISDQAEYGRALSTAAEAAARSRQLVVIGLKPTHPATGFGYIEVGEAIEESTYRVQRFVEKPDLTTATQYVAGGHHFWNLGMLCARCDVLVEALRRYGAVHYQGLSQVVAARAAGDLSLAVKLYAGLPNQAIDYTVLEKASELLMVQAHFGWADVGSWGELAELKPADSSGNFIEGRPVFRDVKNSFISAPGKLVAMIGVEDLVVVDTADALLICPKSRSQEVKEIVQKLNQEQLNDYL